MMTIISHFCFHTMGCVCSSWRWVVAGVKAGDQSVVRLGSSLPAMVCTIRTLHAAPPPGRSCTVAPGRASCSAWPQDTR